MEGTMIFVQFTSIKGMKLQWTEYITQKGKEILTRLWWGNFLDSSNLRDGGEIIILNGS